MPTFPFEHPPADPLPFMLGWLDDARETSLPNPNAMTLATVDPDGRPSARIVLLRGLDHDGAVFYTNRESRKGEGLSAHPSAALLFHWDHLDRQLRIEGAVSAVSDAMSDEYFAGRPRESQINAWASEQSRPVTDRAALIALQDEMRTRFDGAPVPRPPHWGGYRVALDRVEFWQGDPFRFHDRIVYHAADSAWRVTRLCP